MFLIGVKYIREEMFFVLRQKLTTEAQSVNCSLNLHLQSLNYTVDLVTHQISQTFVRCQTKYAIGYTKPSLNRQSRNEISNV